MEENEKNTTEQTTENLPVNSVFKNANTLTMWNDTKLMQQSWRMAEMMSKTSIVPQSYYENAGNCLIAIDIANRMGLSPIMIMQNSQVVQGNFTWKGSACKGLIDNSKRFIKSEYIFFGEKGTNNWGCYLQAYDKELDKIVKGAEVTMQMAINEGWYDKKGSKWKTMPELMMQYRSATFFARAYCPEVMMGFYTNDEIFDIGKGNYEENQPEKIKITMENI